jgi:hypothetical protein
VSATILQSLFTPGMWQQRRQLLLHSWKWICWIGGHLVVRKAVRTSCGSAVVYWVAAVAVWLSSMWHCPQVSGCPQKVLMCAGGVSHTHAKFAHPRDVAAAAAAFATFMEMDLLDQGALGGRSALRTSCDSAVVHWSQLSRILCHTSQALCHRVSGLKYVCEMC